MAKWKTLTISCKVADLLDRLKEEYGINKGFAVEKALEEKYGKMLEEKK